MPLLFLNDWIPAYILRAACWMFVHSLWIGLVAAVLAALIIHSTRSSSARLRYNLLGAILVLFVLAAAFIFYLESKDSGSRHQAMIDVSAVHVADAAAAFTGDTPSRSILDRFETFTNRNAAVIVYAWSLLFLFQFVKLLTALSITNRLRTRQVSPVGEEWMKTLERLRMRLGINQAVAVLQSGLVKVPSVVGYLKPVILVPVGLLSHLSPEQAETILLHELAHIRRRDFLMNILQRLIEAIFAFNPCVLWISSLLREEREACCDDVVVANTSSKRSYLEALVSFQEYAQGNAAFALGIASSKNYLLNRVKRILTRENKKLNFMEKMLLLTGISVITAFTFMPDNPKAGMSSPVAKERPVRQALVYQSQATTGPAKAKAASYTLKSRQPAWMVAVKDTVPQPAEETNRVTYERKRFTSVSTTVNTNDRKKVETVTAKDADGKSYSYTKEDDQLTAFSVDGKQVPLETIGDYSTVLGSMEHAKSEAVEVRQRNAQAFPRKREMMERQQRLHEKQRELRLSQKEQTQQRLSEMRERLQSLPAPQGKQVNPSSKERIRMQQQRAAAAGQRDHERRVREAEIKKFRQMRTIDAQREQRSRRINKGQPILNGREVIKAEKNEPADRIQPGASQLTEKQAAQLKGEFVDTKFVAKDNGYERKMNALLIQKWQSSNIQSKELLIKQDYRLQQQKATSRLFEKTGPLNNGKDKGAPAKTIPSRAISKGAPHRTVI